MLFKSVMLFGAALLFSAGSARYWLLGSSTRVTTALGLAGLAALVLFSFLDLRNTLVSVIPTADAALMWRYLTTTGHGSAVLARSVFSAALGLLLVLPTAAQRGMGVAFLAGTVGLLSTFSVLSHGAVMGGWWPLLSDLVHFVAAGLWAGGVIALVVAPVWDRPVRRDLEAAVGRLSTLGLLTVLALSITGVLNALLQAGDPGAFLASTYLTALLVKLALVVATVALAVVNRFALLPRLRAGGSSAGLRSALRFEAVALVLILVATGWLTTTAVPHDMSSGMSGALNVIDNAEGLIEHLGR